MVALSPVHHKRFLVTQILHFITYKADRNIKLLSKDSIQITLKAFINKGVVLFETNLLTSICNLSYVYCTHHAQKNPILSSPGLF